MVAVSIPFIPAFCPSSGALWKSAVNSIFAGSNKITFRECIESCPVCGGTGHIADGVYDILENAIQILSGPTVTYEKLLALQDLISKELRNPTSAEEIKKTAEKIDPSFGSLVNPFTWNPSVKAATITALGAVIVALLVTTPSQNNTQVTPVTVINNIQGVSAEEILRARPGPKFPIPKRRPSQPSLNRAGRRRQISIQRRRKPQS